MNETHYPEYLLFDCSKTTIIYLFKKKRFENAFVLQDLQLTPFGGVGGAILYYRAPSIV